MARSVRHTPITGITTARSESWDKFAWHKKWRAKERQNLSQPSTLNQDDYTPVHYREVSNTWNMQKDGKRYWTLKGQNRFDAWMGTFGQLLCKEQQKRREEWHKKMMRK